MWDSLLYDQIARLHMPMMARDIMLLFPHFPSHPCSHDPWFLFNVALVNNLAFLVRCCSAWVEERY